MVGDQKKELESKKGALKLQEYFRPVWSRPLRPLNNALKRDTFMDKLTFRFFTFLYPWRFA
jgi:hypothetical protein